MRPIAFIAGLFASAAYGTLSAVAATQLERDFREQVRPFVATYCLECHRGEKPKGDFDLSVYADTAAVGKDFAHWELLADRLRAQEMPPPEAKRHPATAQSQQIVTWIEALRQEEAEKHAGDPGPVFARRLSNAEYDDTIRDLTGVDMRLAQTFPVDPANEAGFDNSSQSLVMTPSLVKKYLAAGRQVSEHLVLKPDGIDFAPHAVVADTDRDKYCVNRIIHFYQRQRTDYADYFYAAWRYKNQVASQATLTQIAADTGLSAKYLATIRSTLDGSADDVGPIAALQALWRELPTSGADHETAARRGCETMRALVVNVRAQLVPKVDNLTSSGVSKGSQPAVLWKDRQMAANRLCYTGGGLKLVAVGLPAGSAAARAMTVTKDSPAAKQFEAACARFCETFPDAFFVSERALIYLDPKSQKDLTGRLLSAGFHNQMGFFRDDGPLYKLLLSDAEQRELDRLWQEFDYIADIPTRQYSNFLWYERGEAGFLKGQEFDFARPEAKDATSDAVMKRFSDLYLAKAIHLGAGDAAVTAIRDYFKEISDRVHRNAELRAAAEPLQLAAIETFAERAYRWPLSRADRDGLAAFYQSLRQQDGLSHEDAMRDMVVSILMSPRFCYRLDLPLKSVSESKAPQSGHAAPAYSKSPTAPVSAGSQAHSESAAPVQPLDDYALASRLSYFLWASMPDQRLLDLAATGQLHRPEVLIATARRMLRDERARGLAIEFTGNWLDFRRFEELNTVDRKKFPTFDNELREAMFEEPVRFFLDVTRRNSSVLDFLYGDYTFVNAGLARHYGMPVTDSATTQSGPLPSSNADAWVRIDNAGKYGRGGLLPMAVFLTKNSPGLRTSPVKRGNWVVRRILGERIPPPPPKVPLLPADESKLGELTLRQALERHRADPSCAACHARFDSLGLVFEGFGPIGELRRVDLGGRLVDTRATFPGGEEGSGLDGLRAYIHQHRESDFVNTLCRQLLAYGLGRTLLPSDDKTLAAMRARLASDGYRFDNLIEVIVTSPQFLNRRANPDVTAEQRD